MLRQGRRTGALLWSRFASPLLEWATLPAGTPGRQIRSEVRAGRDRRTYPSNHAAVQTRRAPAPALPGASAWALVGPGSEICVNVPFRATPVHIPLLSSANPPGSGYHQTPLTLTATLPPRPTQRKACQPSLPTGFQLEITAQHSSQASLRRRLPPCPGRCLRRRRSLTALEVVAMVHVRQLRNNELPVATTLRKAWHPKKMPTEGRRCARSRRPPGYRL